MTSDRYEEVKPTPEDRERVLRLLQEGRVLQETFRHRVEPLLVLTERQRHLRLRGAKGLEF